MNGSCVRRGELRRPSSSWLEPGRTCSVTSGSWLQVLTFASSTRRAVGQHRFAWLPDECLWLARMPHNRHGREWSRGLRLYMVQVPGAMAAGDRRVQRICQSTSIEGGIDADLGHAVREILSPDRSLANRPP